MACGAEEILLWLDSKKVKSEKQNKVQDSKDLNFSGEYYKEGIFSAD